MDPREYATTFQTETTRFSHHKNKKSPSGLFFAGIFARFMWGSFCEGTFFEKKSPTHLQKNFWVAWFFLLSLVRAFPSGGFSFYLVWLQWHRYHHASLKGIPPSLEALLPMTPSLHNGGFGEKFLLWRWYFACAEDDVCADVSLRHRGPRCRRDTFAQTTPSLFTTTFYFSLSVTCGEAANTLLGHPKRNGSVY